MRLVYLFLAPALILGFFVFLGLSTSRADVTLQVQVITPTPTPTPSETPTPTPTPTATPTPTPTPRPPSGGGGGGGGGGFITPAPAAVEFKGYAYPGAPTTILKDGSEAGITRADNQGNFSFILSGLSGGTYNFGFWAQDRFGKRSVTFTFQLIVTGGSTTKVSGIVLPPTIGLSKDSVAAGEKITISGASTPDAQIRIQTASDPKEYLTKTLLSGDYSQIFSTSGLEKGLHTAKSKTEVLKTGDESIYSQLVSFGIGVPAPQKEYVANPDINNDKKVNLVDFSIMAYWWKKKLPVNSPVDLNGDGVLNLADFSILAFNWSG